MSAFDDIKPGDLDAASERLAQQLTKLFEPVLARSLPSGNLNSVWSVEWDTWQTLIRFTMEDGTSYSVRFNPGEPIRIEVYEETEESSDD